MLSERFETCTNQRMLSAFIAAMLVLVPIRASAESGTQNGGGKGPIRIGFITSLSGVSATTGQDMVNGIDLALKEHHNEVCGRKIELIVENDSSSPATAIHKLRKLVEHDKVDVVSGILLATVGNALAPVAEEYNIPVVDSVAASDDLTQRLHFKTLVRLASTCSQSTMPFGEWVCKALKYKKVVTLGMDYPYGWETVGGFQKTFEQAGGKVVQKIWAPMGLTDFSPYLKSINKDADAVFITAIGEAAKVIPKQYHDVGQTLPILGAPTTFDESTLPEAGEYLVGGYSSINYSSALSTPRNQHFVKIYRDQYKRYPSYYSEGAYTSGLWIIKAIEKLKGDVSDRNKLLSALKGIELSDAPRGPLKLDDRSQAVHNIYIRRLEKVGGRLQNTVVETYPNVSQFWKYNPSEYLKQPSYSRDFPPCIFDSHN
jgi:branched-chain amino acid transport system substrate-binding protein